MRAGQVACPECGRALPPDFAQAAQFLPCPSCLESVRVFAFPALHRVAAGETVLPALASDDASCFYHPAKQAVVACDSCGRFLCGLCDIEISGRHRCPGCLETGKRKGKLDTVENRRVLYDGLALTLSIAPVLMWPITILTAPATLFLVVRFWRKPLSILPRTRIRFVLAFLIAAGQVCGWAMLMYFIFARIRSAA